MLEFLVDNIFVDLREKFSSRKSLFQWEQSMPLLLADIFLYSYEAEFIYTVFALNREETVGVSVQFHIQEHR